mmetsp:Transcript_17001/g.39247  ORF Transcript_17001/g.39247 Transcript_17001/m.39247 type:complete len:257 (-) Transcript_17001:712-1482(-)
MSFLTFLAYHCNSLKFPNIHNSLGIVPVNELKRKSNISRSSQFPNSDGRVPVRKPLVIARVSNMAGMQSSDGKVPERDKPEMFRYFNRDKEPSSVGKVPETEAPPFRPSVSKSVASPSSLGSVPSKVALCNLTPSTTTVPAGWLCPGLMLLLRQVTSCQSQGESDSHEPRDPSDFCFVAKKKVLHTYRSAREASDSSWEEPWAEILQMAKLEGSQEPGCSEKLGSTSCWIFCTKTDSYNVWTCWQSGSCDIWEKRV